MALKSTKKDVTITTMKNRKSLTVVSAVCALALTLSLSGCTSSKAGENQSDQRVKLDKENPVTIELWHYYNGAQKTALDRMVTEFNETQGAQQGIIVSASNYGGIPELSQSVMDAVESKVGAQKPPNIFAAYADTAFDLDCRGVVAELSQYLSKEELSLYLESYIEEGRMGIADDGGIKIFPIAKSTEVLVINQTDWDKFAESKSIALEELETIEGVVSASKLYYEWTDEQTPAVPNDGKALFGRDAMANYFIIGARQQGGEIFAVDENNRVTFELSPEIMKKLWDNYYTPFISGYFAANGKFRADDARVGDILAAVGSTTSSSYFPSKVDKPDGSSYPIEATAMPAPKFENAKDFAVQQGAGMVVTKSTPEEEYASVVFLKWFTEPTRNLSFGLSSGYLPVTKQSVEKTFAQKLLDESPPENFSDLSYQTFMAGLQTISSNTLYTSRAFYGGNAARSVLEYSLSDKAAADKKLVDEIIAKGIPRAEAVAQLDTQENFSKWLEQLQQELLKTQKGS